MRPNLLSRCPVPAPLPTAVRQALQPTTLAPHEQRGFALFEVLLVGAAAVAVMAGGYMVYQRAETAHQVAREVDNVGSVAQSVVRVYSSRGGYQGMTNNDAMTGRVFPTQMVNTDGSVRNTWGGAVTVSDAPVSVNGAPASSNNGFKIAYSNVGSAACANFAANAGPGFYDVKVGGTSVLNATTHAIDMPTLTRLCAAAPSTEVDFIYGATTNPLGPNSCSTSLPPGQTRTQPFTCPSGQLISNPGPYQYLASAPQTSQRNPYCSGGGTVSWTDWTAWAPAFSCAPICTGTSTPESAPAPCPAGQISSTSPYGPTSGTESRVNTQTCATPIGPLGPPSNPPWSITGQSCAPVCAAPAPTTATRPAPCPAGQLASTAPYGTTSGTQSQTTNYTCSTPVGPITSSPGPWSAPSGQSCSPACTPTSTPESAPAPCPPGQLASTAPYGATSGTASRINTQTCSTPVGPLGPPSNPPWTVSGQSCSPACAAPPPSTTTVPAPCPPGQVASTAPYGPTSGTQSQTTSYTCATPVGPLNPPSTGPWVVTGQSCAPVCVAPAPTSATRAAPCPPGQLASTAPYATTSGTQTQTTTYSCSTPIGPVTSATGAWGAPSGQSCSPACSAPPPTSTTTPTPCPPGQLASTAPYGTTSGSTTSGINYSCATPVSPVTATPYSTTTPGSCSPVCSPTSGTQTQPAPCPPGQLASSAPYATTSGTQSRGYTQTCSTPVGPLGAPVYGAWGSLVGQSCAPACSAPPPSTATRTQPCPPGTTGSWTQTQTTTYSCSTPVGSATPSMAPWTPASAPAGACTPVAPVYSNPQTCLGMSATVFPGGADACSSSYNVSGAPSTAFTPSPSFTVWFQVTVTYGANVQTVSNKATVNTVTSASGAAHCSGASDYECNDAITGTPTVVTIGGKQFTVSASGSASQLYDPSSSINKWLGRTGAGSVTSP